MHRPASITARLAAACALAMAACCAHAGEVRVEVAGPKRDTVRLIDTMTQSVIALDRMDGEPVRGVLVAPDDSVVAVTHGAADDGDSLALYAIAWSRDRVTGARAGRVSQVLAYRPRDGHLRVVLQQVPNGVVARVESGRFDPHWRKVFLFDAARGAWIAWPRALAPADATAGMPQAVGNMNTGDPYTPWMRPSNAQGAP